jgi:putative DNA primase/helicase
MARPDLAALKRAITLPDLIARYGVDLRRGAKGLEALCPFHNESTPSFTVFTGGDGNERFFCFGCGAKGDHLDFIAEYDNISDPKEARRRLQELVGGGVPANDNKPAQRRVEPQRQEWVAIAAPEEPAPRTLRINRDDKWVETPVVAAWPYRNRAGQLWGYACRVEFTKGDGTTGKDVIPYCYFTNAETGECRWRQGSLPQPRLLYGTELLDAEPAANVVLVEGEKAADAARRLLAGTGLLVVTWPGGCKAVERADWSLLAGRKVVGWPDCDSQVDKRSGRMLAYAAQPGMRAMLRIAELVDQHGGAMRVVAVPMPGQIANGWDMADAESEGWTGERALAFLREHLRTPAEIRAMSDETPPPEPQPPPDEPEQDDGPPPDDDIPPPDAPPYDGEPDDEPQPRQRRHAGDGQPMGDQPFRVLGYDRGTAYYLPNGFSQVVALSAAAHSKNNLLMLAPLHWWQMAFPSDKRSGDRVDWMLANESLIRRAQNQGIYDPDLVRGRGAWWEEGRWAVHLGDRVVIDGVEHDLRTAPTRYVYEAAKPIPMNVSDPLKTGESIKLVEICESLRWDRPIYGKLLAGWVFLAPVCGALSWRPHIWITGAAGSGKSTAMTDIIGRCLRGLAIETQGDSSEAGLRQALRQDALPVVFDEFESERKRSAENVDNVMAMVTRASSNTNASLIKGGQDGQATAFKTRAMFCFSSIGVNMKQHAARTRVTVLSLYSAPETPESLAQYNAMMKGIFDTLTDQYIARLQARAVRLLPVIRHNARVFAEAAAIVLQDRRMGDQIGALLAGAYALHSDREANREFAEEWIRKQAWDEVTEVGEGRDENSCLAYLLTYQMRVETEKGINTRSIGELIQIASYALNDHNIGAGDANTVLKRSGVMVTQTPAGQFTVSIAGSHPTLAHILRDTSWAQSYTRTLKRLPGAEPHAAKKYGVTTHRGVTLPMSALQ